MGTLLIELAGAQQAWGSRSRFASRGTELAPTKSGVIGLLAAALGLDRTASLERFDRVRFGVRVDQPGRLEQDFQTTRSLDGRTSFPLSRRYYLADAVFVAGVEAAPRSLAEFRSALARPYYPLFLGRRAFPPSGPVWTELVELPLRDALAGAPWRARAHHRRKVAQETASLELILDVAPGARPDETRQDEPESFDPRRRRHGTRGVTITRVDVPHPDPARRTGGHAGARRGAAALLGSPTAHDPEILLSDEEV